MADDGGKNVDNPVSAASSFEQEPSEVNSPAAAAGVASDVDNASQMARMTFARFGTTPTNWHQATIYFLTSTDEQDRSMRKKAPLMYVGGIVMVLVQIFTTWGVLLGMVAPPCVNNQQCADYHYGFYCFRQGYAGRCKACGEDAPLIPYFAETKWPGVLSPRQITMLRDPECLPAQGFDTCNPRQEFNVVLDQSYPIRGGGNKREQEPDAFAGWNMSMVKDRCYSGTIQSFRYKIENIGTDEAPMMVVSDADGPGLPAGFTPSRAKQGSYTAEAVTNWCQGCTHIAEQGSWRPAALGKLGLAQHDNETGIEVSVMNNRLQAMLSMSAMMTPDWVALFLCSYVVGMTVNAESKDTALCAMAIKRKVVDLNIGWQIALEALNTLRSHFFLQALLSAIPVVVLSQGGSALEICFNTVAVLFITDIDNMSYTHGLGERAKERVDQNGHVVLTDEECTQLSRTKILCTVTCVIGPVWLVHNGAIWGAMMSGAACALIFKLSELASTWGSLTPRQRGVFVVKAFASQWMSLIMFQGFFWYYKDLGNQSA